MNFDARFQLRLPAALVRAWKVLVPDRLASHVLRLFMEKAIDAIRRNPMKLGKFVTGRYEIEFEKK